MRQIEHSRDFFWHRLRWRALSFHLPKEKPFRLVDVGAGAGLLGDFLRRQVPAAEYGFVEPLSSLETYLESIYGSEANFRAAEVYHGTQVVTLMDVLEHQPDDHEFLREIAGRMEIGAVLVVTVPALQSLWSQWDVALGHFRRYDKASFRRCLAGLPFEIRELSYLMPEMVPLGWLRKLVRGNAPIAEGNAQPAEFPDLPRAVNDLIYGLGCLSLQLRRASPLGSSLMAVLVRRDGLRQRQTKRSPKP